jgi:hypothetical protein
MIESFLEAKMTIALPAFHITTMKRHQVEFPHALQQELDAYRAFYKQTYGADVSDADLIREIVRCFLGTDEGFQRFKAGSAGRSGSRSKRRVRDSNGLPSTTAEASSNGQRSITA